MATTPDIIPANAHLIGFWLQCLFSGAYFVYFPKCVIILRRKVRDGLSFWLPLVCGLFFALTVTSLIVEMHRAYEAYSVNPPALPNPTKYYANAASPQSLIKNTINVVQAIISDAVIVYRTWVVWNGNYFVIIVPFLTLIADAAMGVWSVWTLSQTKTGDVLILAAVTVRVRYFYILTFCINILCASLICFRIWRAGFNPRNGYSNGSPLSRVMAVVVESAGFYCAYLLVLIVSNIVGSNVFFIFLDPTPPVVAIVYSMLIVRSHAPREVSSTPLASTLQFSRTRASTLRPGVQTASIGVEINLERVVHTDLGSPRTYVHSDHPYAADDKESQAQAY